MTFRKIAIAFLLVVSMMVGLAGTIDVQAASKKTVRVATEKELKAALKNSSVGTVILRTGTYDPITISSKKAKKKKIIVDAPNSIITNKSVFKSVEILSARKYIEDVSGNKVSSDGKTQIEIAAGKSMKKLTFSNLSVDFVIRKGAAIKSLSYENEYVSSSFNSKTRELIYCDTLNSFMGKEYVKEYTLTLDKSGRVLSISREGNALRTYKYDDNGNLLEDENKLSDTGEILQYIKSKYDKNDNMIAHSEEYSTFLYWEESEYDKNGNKTKSIGENGSGSFVYDIEYDSKGRMTRATVSMESEKSDSKYVVEYTYNKQGYLIKQVEMVNDELDTVSEYEYDKSGNKIFFSYLVKDPKGDDRYMECKYSYDDLGNETGRDVTSPKM